MEHFGVKVLQSNMNGPIQGIGVMSAERMHPPKYWRMRAEEFRTKADNCEFSETREALQKVAKNYDDLARRAEQIRTIQDAAEYSCLGTATTNLC